MSDKVHLMTVSRGDDLQFLGVFQEYISAYDFIPKYLSLMSIENPHILESKPMGSDRVQIVSSEKHRIVFVIHTLHKSQLEVHP